MERFVAAFYIFSQVHVITSAASNEVNATKPFISINKSEYIQSLPSTFALDICFLIDLTWSMEPYLENVKDWILDIANQLSSASRLGKGSFRLSFVGYRDLEDSERFVILPFVKNTTAFAQLIGNLKTQGGGDIPEDVFGGITRVSLLEWNAGSQRALFHFTDAPCYHKKCGVEDTVETGPGNKDSFQIVAKLKEERIQYFFGNISRETETMIHWFQELYGESIPIFDLGIEVSNKSRENIEIKSFVTVEDFQNAFKLKQNVTQDNHEANEPHPPSQFPWSDHSFEGDIDLLGLPLDALVDSIKGEQVLTELSDFVDLENAVTEKFRLWPNGIIPYIISTKFTEQQRAIIALAMDTFSSLTCIRWIPRRGIEKNFVSFELGPATTTVCRSAVGRALSGQETTLSSECFKETGIIMHEMMHTIGFIHEQSRSDRDDYVEIQWQNLPNGEDNPNYLTYGVDKIDNMNANYDYSSIMHYPRTIDGIVAVIPLIPVIIGQRVNLSDTDVYKINKLYDCLENDIPVCDPGIECVNKAQKGECVTNSTHMLSECYKYCQLCHKKPSKEALEEADRISLAGSIGQQGAICALECQDNSKTKVTHLPIPADGGDVRKDDISKYQENLCEIYAEMKACILECEDGDTAWLEVWNDDTSLSIPRSILHPCGLDGDSYGQVASNDFQQLLCAQDCQFELGKQINGKSGFAASATQSDIFDRENMFCEAYTALKFCVISCSDGVTTIWDSTFSSDYSSILEQCEIDLNKSSVKGG